MNTDYWVGKYDVHGVIYPHDGPHSTQGKAEKALKMLTVMNKVDKFGIISVTTLETEADRIDSEVDDVCEFLFGCTGAECRPDVVANIRAIVEEKFKRPEGGSLPEKETSSEIQLDTSMYDFTIQCDGGAFDLPVKTGGRMAGVYSQIVRDRKRRNAVNEMMKEAGVNVENQKWFHDRRTPIPPHVWSIMEFAGKLVDAGYIKGMN